ncbi:branched-chain amino acid ABC transporter permease [Burkholderia sp. SRS-W-2-2016]|uniref:branched-chain amino acid ABC transporter permease n=1 Tax=Burkholderia sp. SRS-W-2-2016 TaxID=1926878 RepID=UPI00094ADD98|nr:branched-chain amino acid ABC transporter permease [Burkholderia sp. SRS-W-2-2016]OLL28709.1 branched-chain amino acid ABC transporter permease [Burkholderia sp. SRS-W-2-2016]
MKLFEGKTGWTLLFALGLAFPFAVANDYMLTVMSTAYIFALATVGLNLITGYTGQFNLAHGSFMALGAYTVGILTVDHQVPFWLAFVAAGVVVAVFGALVGLVSLRLRGHYFSIFTLCVGYIMFLVIEKWDSLTHGVTDIIGIPAPSGFGLVSFETPRALYYLTFAFLVLGMWLMHRIVNSLLGRTFMAIRNSDGLAQSLGINLMRNKVLAFVLSVIYAGLAGGLYAGAVRFLGPDLAGVEHTFDMTMYMLVGGIGTLAGPLLGALLVPWLTQYLQFLQEYRFVVFGPILILLVIFLPNGIVGLYHARQHKRARRAAASNGGVNAAQSSRAPRPTHGDGHA